MLHSCLDCCYHQGVWQCLHYSNITNNKMLPYESPEVTNDCAFFSVVKNEPVARNYKNWIEVC